MKFMQAQKLTDFIMTDDWHGINGEYDYAENGINFVIEYNHFSKKVFVHAKGGEVFEKAWKGTKDHMTRNFRDWLHKTINENLPEIPEVQTQG